MPRVRTTPEDLAERIARESEFPTLEQVNSHGFNFYPEHWLSKWDDTRMPAVPSILSEEGRDDRGRKHLTRHDLFQLGAAVKTEEDAVNFYVAVCSWGCGTKARDIYRRVRTLPEPEFGRKLLAGILLAGDPSVSSAVAYESFYSNAKNRILGLGPAFFTKVLYFASNPGDDRQLRHLILDRKVAATTNWPPRSRWTPAEYSDYITLVNETVEKVPSIERADCVEKYLFAPKA